MRRRQRVLDRIKEDLQLSPRQKEQAVRHVLNDVPGMRNIPANYVDPDTIGQGLLGTGLFKPRPNIEQTYNEQITTKGKPLYVNVQTFSLFFVEYNNSNVKGIGQYLKSFAVIRTLSPISVKECSNLLGNQAKNLTGLIEQTYQNGSFSHPSYINDDGTPLIIRYAEIGIVTQRTPGRLDNIPLGFPDFDSTPDGIITSVGPIPGPPYARFVTATGATFPVQTPQGGTVYYIDATPQTPWQFAPTGWAWDFGATASPSGSTAQNPPIVTYSTAGTFTVSLTASNAYGSNTTTSFVVVT